MLTRGQVAKRLGKSIATVRRLEGRELHPQRDASGVLRFDPDEVEAFVNGVSSDAPRGGRSSWLSAELEARDDDDPATNPLARDDFDERVRAAAEKLVRDEFARRDQEQLRREAARREREQAEALATRREVVALLESCSDSELAMLAEDPEFSELLDELSEVD